MGINIKCNIDPNAEQFQQKGKRAEVLVEDPISVKKWAAVLNLTELELIKAVKEFGPFVKDIRIGLRNRKGEEAA